MGGETRILCLSGGGFLGLYTIKVLEEIEIHTGRSINETFDLITGTSIGGVIALGLAAGKPASEIRHVFQEFGPLVFGDSPPPMTRLGKARELYKNMFSPKYSSSLLRKIIEQILGSDICICDLKTNVAIPAVNMTNGRPCVFKTPHHKNFTRDLKLKLSDVALATSAAPTFFPLHKIGGELFADGGLFANSPDQIGLTEAMHYLKIPRSSIKMLSIGTPKLNNSISNQIGSNIGILGWFSNQRLLSIMSSTQDSNTSSMMKMILGDNYHRIETEIPKGMACGLALDCASEVAQADLLALAESSVRSNLPHINSNGFI